MSLRVLVLVLVVFQSQACSASLWDFWKPQASESSAALETPEAPVAHKIHETKELELVAGMDLSKLLAEVVGQKTNGKAQNLGDLLSHSRRNVLALVKPGCIYCESWLALMKAGKNKIDANIIYILDAEHADFQEFQQKAESSEAAKGEWFYDLHNGLYESLGISSFPRFLVIDKEGRLIKHQQGLVLPENKESLRQLEMPLILQKLSKETITWLEQY